MIDNESEFDDQEPTYEVLSGKDMQKKYGLFAENRPIIILNPDNVPDVVKPLIPYAEKWGISDDLIREDVIDEASIAELEELVYFMDGIEFPPIDKWLTGPEAQGPKFSDEYIAVTCLVMAATSAAMRLRKLKK